MKIFFIWIAMLCGLLPAGCGILGEPLPAAALYESRSVPIVMYHSILKDPARAGKYILSPDDLEADIRLLLDEGYETVLMRDLIAFVDGSGELPEKPVMLTFDDGYLNNLTYVLPLLEQYDCRAVISVVGSYTEAASEANDPNPNYAYASWDELKGLVLSDRFELQNHSYGLHGQVGRVGAKRTSGESEAQFCTLFRADVTRLQDALDDRVGVTPTTYAYPFGEIDPASRALLAEMGFRATLTCFESVNTVTRGMPDCLWGLGRFNRPSGISSEAFFSRVLAHS